MDHPVPYFQMANEVYGIPNSSNMPETEFKNPPIIGDSTAELSLQNRQNSNTGIIITEQSAIQSCTQHEHLFMQEYEMASWLQDPLVDNSLSFNSNFAELLHPLPCLDIPTVEPGSIDELRPQACRPPAPPQPEYGQIGQNFGMLTMHKPKIEPGNSVKDVATVFESSDSLAGPEVKAGNMQVGGGIGVVAGSESAGALSIGGERAGCGLTAAFSSFVGSIAGAEPRQTLPAENRKQEGRERHNEKDVKIESAEGKKNVSGSISTKRSRVAEVHNLSERRRRDRINDKMKALQELIPHSNKADKASILDEAIEYLKSLQEQVKIMSMGCGTVPMMFPSVQPYMAPILPFPTVFAGSPSPTPAAAVHLAQRFPMPAFRMPIVPAPDLSGSQTTNFSFPMQSSLRVHSSIHPHALPFADPYQQYLGLQQMQLHLPQNHVTLQPSSRLDTIGEFNNLDNHQSG